MSHFVCENTLETEVGNIYPPEKFTLIRCQTANVEAKWAYLYLSGVLAFSRYIAGFYRALILNVTKSG